MKTLQTDYKNVDLSMFHNFKNVKVIVFDFDDTLYKYLPWNNYNQYFLKRFKKLFPNFSKKQFEELVIKYNLKETYRVTETAAQIMVDMKMDTKQLVNLLRKIKFSTEWSKGQVFPQKITRALAKNYNLYIVSNSSPENIKYVSRKLKINLKYFKAILSNNFIPKDLTKMARLKDIFILEEGIKPQEILMVGDSMQYDILPAKALGMQTMIIKN